ncbi:MAG: hypothetical protein V4528_07210 [Pseudomonadota bacterium]
MISGIAVALTGQSAQGVAIASGAGANAAQNNYLTHQQAENKKTELSKAKTPQERAAIEAKYQQLDNAQQTAAEQCLLAGQCQSVTDPLMLQGALNDLKNACAVPRYCSPDEVKSITQLNRLLDQDAITPNHLLEELVIGGGVGKIVGAGVSTVAARLFGGAIGKAAETIGVNGESAFSYYMQQARTLNVSTSENASVFYSGPGNRVLAEQFANANGRTTLEMTPGGSWLDAQMLFSPNSSLSPTQAVQVWSTLSERFAAGASGNAIGFTQGARAGSIFNTIEFPTLLKNPNVTNVLTGGH